MSPLFTTLCQVRRVDPHDSRTALAPRGRLRAHGTTLVDTPTLKVLRLDLPAGHETTEREPRGDVVVHCLTGRLTVITSIYSQRLSSGEMLCLQAPDAYWLRALDQCSVLLTIAGPWPTKRPRLDIVQEAGEESFPASDPPARTVITGP